MIVIENKKRITTVKCFFMVDGFISIRLYKIEIFNERCKRQGAGSRGQGAGGREQGAGRKIQDAQYFAHL